MMRDALTTAEVKLTSAEGRVADLTTLVRRLEEEAEQEKSSHEEIGVSLSQTEAQLSDANKALVDTESQRDSLALQVSHLQQDLETAKAELSDAEARYTTLQNQQLATMTTSAQNRALKDQIELLQNAKAQLEKAAAEREAGEAEKVSLVPIFTLKPKN